MEGVTTVGAPTLQSRGAKQGFKNHNKMYQVRGSTLTVGVATRATEINGYSTRGKEFSQFAALSAPTNQRSSELPHDGARPRRVSSKQDLYSPLRYPGGKRQMVSFFVELLRINKMVPLEVFVEPFAGGAAVSLHLLASGLVDRIVLADLDPLVYAFWYQACYATDELIEDLLNAPVTLEEWHRLRANPGTSLREQAYACLFLNRTSYSGILQGRAGPIGGQRQESRYKIDCRFPKEELANRIRQIGQFAAEGRVLAVLPYDVEMTVQWVTDRLNDQRHVFYFDPPFWTKGSRLYRHSFTREDHERLARLLKRLDAPWVLSYDYHDEIIELYQCSRREAVGRCASSREQLDGSGGHKLHTTQLQYCNRHRGRRAQELVITNLPIVPRAHVERLL